MFQLVGGLLALASILSVLADSPLNGTLFALLTFAWVLVAKPAAKVPSMKYDAPRGVVLGA